MFNDNSDDKTKAIDEIDKWRDVLKEWHELTSNHSAEIDCSDGAYNEDN